MGTVFGNVQDVVSAIAQAKKRIVLKNKRSPDGTTTTKTPRP